MGRYTSSRKIKKYFKELEKFKTLCKPISEDFAKEEIIYTFVLPKN
jgi:hypothetical protein